MNFTFKLLLFFVCIKMTVMAQLGEKCNSVPREYESSNEGKAITNCVNMGKASDLNICSHTECMNMKLPESISSSCTTEQEKVMIKTLIVTIDELNSVYSKICSSSENSTNSVIQSSNIENKNNEKKSNENEKIETSTNTSNPITNNKIENTTNESSATKISISLVSSLIIAINLLI